MHDKRWLLVLVGILLLGSLAGAAMWQLNGDEPSTTTAAADAAVPASRAIFPKVLQR